MNLRLLDALFALPQYALPHHPLSRLMGLLTHWENTHWKNLFIRWFAWHYQVDLSEAEPDEIKAFRSFNQFFTRSLKAGVRPLPADPKTIVSPADGVISQLGTLRNDQLLQAKGRSYRLADLLGGDPEQAKPFLNGRFATVYLSPRDYHRLHMPLAGTLTAMTYVPGRLFSVNRATTAIIPNLFARNERVIAHFATDIGPMAVVLVGALLVASIETTWHGVITPPHGHGIRTWRYRDAPVRLERGEELGRFNMGSTVILLFGEGAVHWNTRLGAGTAVQMGQSMV